MEKKCFSFLTLALSAAASLLFTAAGCLPVCYAAPTGEKAAARVLEGGYVVPEGEVVTVSAQSGKKFIYNMTNLYVIPGYSVARHHSIPIRDRILHSPCQIQ